MGCARRAKQQTTETLIKLRAFLFHTDAPHAHLVFSQPASQYLSRFDRWQYQMKYCGTSRLKKNCLRFHNMKNIETNTYYAVDLCCMYAIFYCDQYVYVRMLYVSTQGR